MTIAQLYVNQVANSSDLPQAVKSNPLVVFMKGTPDAPQCGFSRAVCQILDVQVSDSRIHDY